MSSTEPVWFKSSHSGGGGGNCVEVAVGSGGVLVRDSKDLARPLLRVSSSAWSAFTTHTSTTHRGADQPLNSGP